MSFKKSLLFVGEIYLIQKWKRRINDFLDYYSVFCICASTAIIQTLTVIHVFLHFFFFHLVEPLRNFSFSRIDVETKNSCRSCIVFRRGLVV